MLLSKFQEKLEKIKEDNKYLDDYHIDILSDLFIQKEKKDINFLLFKPDGYIWNYYRDVYFLLRALKGKNKITSDIIEKIEKTYGDLFKKKQDEIFIDILEISSEKLELFKELAKINQNTKLYSDFTKIFINLWDKESFLDYYLKFLIYEETYVPLWKREINFIIGAFLKDEFLKLFWEINNYLKNELKDTKFRRLDLPLLKNLSHISKTFFEELLNVVKKLNNKKINKLLKELIINWIKITKITYFDRSLLWSDFFKVLNDYLYENTKDWYIELYRWISELESRKYEIDIIKLICSNIRRKEELINFSNTFPNIFNWLYYDLLKEDLNQYLPNTQWKSKTQEIQEYRDNQEKEDKNKKKKDEKKIKDEIKKIITDLEKNDTLISPKLLYDYEEYNVLFTDKQKIFIKKHLKKILESPVCNLDEIKYHYTKTSENSWTSSTSSYVSDWTIFRCIKFGLDHFWYSINDFKKYLIKYFPFSEGGEEVKYIKEKLNILKKDEVNYLINVYNWSRDDDLAYDNWRKILHLLEKENILNSFINHNKKWFIEMLKFYIHDKKQYSHSRKDALELLVEKIKYKDKIFLQDIFNKYIDKKINYFNDILVNNWNNREKIWTFKIWILANSYLIKNFQDNDSVLWRIEQLLKWNPEFKEPLNWVVHMVSELESEISHYWLSIYKKELERGINPWKMQFVDIFYFIHKAEYEENIKELLIYSFKLLNQAEKENKNYEIYSKFIQQAVYFYYKNIENKNLDKYIDLEIYIDELNFDDKYKISFKNAFLEEILLAFTN